MCLSHYTRERIHGNPLAGKILKTQIGEAQKWLFAHVAHKGEGCLIWPFSCFSNGRAQIEYHRQTMNAARLMCIQVHGEPPSPRHHAAHSCGKGQRGCVHPQHVSWKTPAENEADKIVHGTKCEGEKNGTAKLTEESVAEIRSLKGKLSQRALAARFGITQPNVGYIHRRDTWRSCA